MVWKTLSVLCFLQNVYLGPKEQVPLSTELKDWSTTERLSTKKEEEETLLEIYHL